MKDIKNKGFLKNEKTNTFTANIITVNGILSASQQNAQERQHNYLETEELS